VLDQTGSDPFSLRANRYQSILSEHKTGTRLLADTATVIYSIYLWRSNADADLTTESSNGSAVKLVVRGALIVVPSFAFYQLFCSF
jgi:hypothetical protein